VRVKVRAPGINPVDEMVRAGDFAAWFGQIPMALGAVTLGLLAVGHVLWETAAMMIAWGALNSAIPVSWSTWLTKGISDEPESGGGLIVAAIQLSIGRRSPGRGSLKRMAGAGFRRGIQAITVIKLQSQGW
jgi:predicted MFS family arabinose efflux permease